jgi:heme-degrading monooxygenase HmoA
VPADKRDRRVIVGTWRTHADWEAWHHDPLALAGGGRVRKSWHGDHYGEGAEN